MIELIGLKPFSNIGEVLLINKTAKIFTATISIILLFAVAGLMVYATFGEVTPQRKDFLINTILPFLVIPLVLIFISVSAHFSNQFSETLSKEINDLRKERVVITEKIEKEKELDIFHTIQLSLNQLNEYYTINKNQARSSFRLSAFAIVLGLLTIVIGVWLYYLDIANVQIGYITGISGIILEFIGGAYFFMYKKSLEQVNFFFGQLIKIQDTMLSINIADDIEDPVKKIEMNERIIISLLERSLK